MPSRRCRRTLRVCRFRKRLLKRAARDPLNFFTKKTSKKKTDKGGGSASLGCAVLRKQTASPRSRGGNMVGGVSRGKSSQFSVASRSGHPCFTVFFGPHPLNLGGEGAPPNLGDMGCQGRCNFSCDLYAHFQQRYRGAL